MTNKPNFKHNIWGCQKFEIKLKPISEKVWNVYLCNFTSCNLFSKNVFPFQVLHKLTDSLTVNLKKKSFKMTFVAPLQVNCNLDGTAVWPSIA